MTNTAPLFTPMDDGKRRDFHVTSYTGQGRLVFAVTEERDGEEIDLDSQAVRQLGEALANNGRM